MEKKAYLFYADYEDYFRKMNADDCKAVICAFFEYARTGEEPNLDGVADIVFTVLKKGYIRDDEHYANACKARSEAGKKGGLISGNVRKKKAEANKAMLKNNEANEAMLKNSEANEAMLQNSEANEANEPNTNNNNNNNTNTNTNNNISYSSAIASERVCVSKTTDDIQKKDKSGLSTKQLESEFEELWNMYPHERRQGKKKAYAAYERARKGGAAYERIKKGLSDYNKQIAYEKTEIRYVKLAETWFSGEH